MRLTGLHFVYDAMCSTALLTYTLDEGPHASHLAGVLSQDRLRLQSQTDT